jgi:hypothetical protein
MKRQKLMTDRVCNLDLGRVKGLAGLRISSWIAMMSLHDMRIKAKPNSSLNSEDLPGHLLTLYNADLQI